MTKLTLIIPIGDYDTLIDNDGSDNPNCYSGDDIYVANRIPEKKMMGDAWLNEDNSEVAIQVTIEKVLKRIDVPKLVEVKE